MSGLKIMWIMPECNYNEKQPAQIHYHHISNEIIRKQVIAAKGSIYTNRDSACGVKRAKALSLFPHKIIYKSLNFLSDSKQPL